MVLPATDCYAVLLAAFFVRLDGYAELTHPRKPPAPKWVSNERLQNSRSAAYEEALKRWKIDYLQPWQQCRERHDKQKSAERLKTLRNRTSEAAAGAAGDETAIQRQDSERDRKRQRRDEQRSIQCDGAPFTSQLDVMILDVGS